MMETNTGVVTYPVTNTLGHFLERELQFFFTFLTFKKRIKIMISCQPPPLNCHYMNIQ